MTATAMFFASAPSDERRRRYLMCPPAYFAVSYSINPWMRPAVPVDAARALRQWECLRSTYESLGHHVDVVEAVPGLPDMVFTANAGLVMGATVLPARFRHNERRGEEAPLRRWFEAQGFTDVRAPVADNEGEGDLLPAGGLVLAGWGPRTRLAAHAEVAAAFGRPIVPLHLVDPRFYHLDTALAVLDDRRVMYFPAAFSPNGRRRLEALFPDAVMVGEDDACAFGLNAASDGRHVVLPAGAPVLARRLAAEGYEPVPVDMSELIKAGGAVKCCTLELRP